MNRFIKIVKYTFIGFVVLGVIGMFLPDTATESQTDTVQVQESKSPEPKKTKEKDSTPTLGSKVRDGKFEFVVKSVKCGIPSVSTSWSREKAMGEFCKVSLTVTNIGNESQMFFDSNQTLIDSKDREFDSKSILGAQDADMWLSNINPGLTLSGSIYFDVPVGTKVKAIELHDSMFSGGVVIKP